MNADESRRLYPGVELHRPSPAVRCEIGLSRGGHRLMLFSTTAYRKIRMHGLGLCGDSGI